ncbi:hypothetical protein MUG91_G43n111 [Manis pentadactyla]|nr:hypothetical protein MUG91_G43n111 [Manis pentadactyla]
MELSFLGRAAWPSLCHYCGPTGTEAEARKPGPKQDEPSPTAKERIARQGPWYPGLFYILFQRGLGSWGELGRQEGSTHQSPWKTFGTGQSSEALHYLDTTAGMLTAAITCVAPYALHNSQLWPRNGALRPAQAQGLAAFGKRKPSGKASCQASNAKEMLCPSPSLPGPAGSRKVKGRQVSWSERGGIPSRQRQPLVPVRLRSWSLLEEPHGGEAGSRSLLEETP